MLTRPPGFTFDLRSVLSSLVSLRIHVPEDAPSAARLGSEREGHGVHIGNDGLILTVGYLVTEAETIWIIDANGGATLGHALATDSESGFGLVKALGHLNIPSMALGSSADLHEGDPVIVAGYGGDDQIITANVLAKREFAGNWEYLLDEGIFTVPAHPNWGGAALIDSEGNLAGIGSLFVQQMGADNQTIDGNMIIPIDLLKPILSDLITHGRSTRPPKPWMGISTSDAEDRLVISRVNREGPSEQAGLKAGDVILEVCGAPVRDLGSFYRTVWKAGEAGVEVPIRIERDHAIHDVVIHTRERQSRVRPAVLH